MFMAVYIIGHLEDSVDDVADSSFLTGGQYQLQLQGKPQGHQEGLGQRSSCLIIVVVVFCFVDFY